MGTYEEPSEPKTEIKAYFAILNFTCPHEFITTQIGVEPSATWLKGDVVKRSTVRRKSNGWRLDSELPQSADLEQHAIHILNRIYPRATAVTSIEGYTARLSFIVHIYGLDRPPMVLPEDVVERLASLKARVEIDLYNFEAE